MDKNNKGGSLMIQKNRNTVLVFGALLQLFLGIIYVWSVFVAPVSEYYNWAISDAKLTSSFMLSFFAVGILLGGKIQLKIGTKKNVLFGGLLLAVGVFLSGLVPTSMPWLIYITYGIFGGFGVGMSYSTIIGAAQKNFPDKRGLATGISVCTFGFATVIFTPLVQWLVKTVGIQNTFFCLATSFAVVTLVCFSFITTPDVQSSASSFSGKQYTTGEMVKTSKFYLIAGSMMFSIAAFFILNPSFFTLAEERGLSASMAATMLMISGIANAAGRLIFPLISDKLGAKKTLVIMHIITTICALSLTVASGGLLIVVVSLIACCYGGTSGVYPVFTGDHFGLQHVGANYGAVMVSFALSSLIFPLLLSPISSMMAKFIILGAVAAVAALMVFMVKTEKK